MQFTINPLYILADDRISYPETFCSGTLQKNYEKLQPLFTQMQLKIFKTLRTLKLCKTTLQGAWKCIATLQLLH